MISLFRPKPYDVGRLRELESRLGMSFGVSVDLLAACRLRHVTISDDYVSLKTNWGGNTYRYLPLWWLDWHFNNAGLFFPPDGSAPVVCMCPECGDPLIFITADLETFCRRPQRYLGRRDIEKNYGRFDSVRPPWLTSESAAKGLSAVLSPYCLAAYDFYHVKANRPTFFATIMEGLEADHSAVGRIVATQVTGPDDLFSAKRLWGLSEILLQGGFRTEALQVADNALYCGCQEATRQVGDDYQFETYYDEIEAWYRRLLDVAVEPPCPTLIESRIAYCKQLKALTYRNKLRTLVH